MSSHLFHICHFHLFLQQTFLHTPQQFKVKNSLADTHFSEDLYDKHSCISGCPAISAYLAASISLQLLFLSLSANKNTCASSSLTLGAEQPKMTSCVVNNWPITWGLHCGFRQWKVCLWRAFCCASVYRSSCQNLYETLRKHCVWYNC